MKIRKFKKGDIVQPHYMKYATFKIIDHFIDREGKEYTYQYRNLKLDELMYFYEKELKLITKGTDNEGL